MLLRALGSATLASVLSTCVVSIAARRQTGFGAAGTNATSHWLWGERAKRAHRPDLRHTAVGYAIHHASSLFWAVFHEYWRELRPHTRPSTTAAGVTAVAYLVDYHVVPRRLTPGFERHLSGWQMFATYAVFGLGLYVAARLMRRR